MPRAPQRATPPPRRTSPSPSPWRSLPPVPSVTPRLAHVGLVFVGGAVGTLARYLVTMAVPAWNGLPLPTFVVNVTGAFLLGALLVALARRGPDTGWRRAMRLF